MPNFRLILFPVSLIYAGIIRLRNFLFDKKILEAKVYSIPLICVGNLKIGGAGKTPFTELLIRMLGPENNLATLSRGYGRSTRGLLMAGFPADSLLVGDEPAQFKNKFPSMPVCVAEDRREGIWCLIQSGIKLIILDDAFQHRRVNYGLRIVLIEYADLFKPVISLPAGNYREPLSSLFRASMVVITKSAEIITEEAKVRIRRFLRQDWSLPLFFSTLVYELPVPVFQAPVLSQHIWDSTRKVILITGIANPASLVAHLQSRGLMVIHQSYLDHHNFTYQDIEKLSATFKAENTLATMILTTEKDAQRLKIPQLFQIASALPLYYLPIRAEIIQADKKEFESFIFEYVNSAL